MDKLDRLVGVRFSQNDFDKIKSISDAKKRKPSDFIRIIVQNFLDTIE